MPLFAEIKRRNLFRVAIVILTGHLSTTALAQTQLGADIDGKVTQLDSSYVVSLSSDGNRLAIGARSYNGWTGQVLIFQWSGTAWSQLGTDIDGETVEDLFGGSVSLSAGGNRVAIGASGSGDAPGHVHVYHWSGTAWTQLGEDINGEAVFDRSGNSVSLSFDGDRLAIGAPGNDGNGNRSGHVRVYHWSGTAWAQLGADIDGEAAGDGSGDSISLSSDGNHLAIASPYTVNSFGHVRVYQWSGIVWEQLGTAIDGEAVDDFSGSSVSLSSDGNRVAIGARSNDGNGENSGHVRVYHWSGSAWTQLGADIDGEAAGDAFGRSVSLSSNGNRLVIGANSNDGNGENAGQGRVYHWSGTVWTQLGIDLDGDAAHDSLGAGVSLSSDGNRLAIGTGRHNLDGATPGYVRVYDLSMFNVFRINAGLNDAWYNPDTDGQGFFITVFPDLDVMLLAWFTYDTELPTEEATANLGDPGHRWLLAVGPIEGNQSIMEVEMTSGGLFDTATVIERTNPPGSDGTIILTFASCNSGTVEYDIPSINRQEIVPIQRVAKDNIVLCEALKAE